MKDNTRDEEYFMTQRSLDKIFFSEAFSNNNIIKRFGHKILDYEQNEFILQDKKTLGFSFDGKRQLKALFFQDNNRKVEKLLLQQFGSNDEIPLRNRLKEASFSSQEIEALYLFLKGIKEVNFPNNNTFNVKDSELKKMLLDKDQASKLIEDNLEILQDALMNNITKKDLINFGYRKNQLEKFNKLLNEDGYFEKYKLEIKEEFNKDIGDESVWQKFFEKNTWILGYGLDYIFNSELDNKKLEQITSGSNFFTNGKRVDALLKSQGAINSLCFCELKLSSDKLLKQVKDSYRAESWQISDSLAGAISQVQRTTHKAIKDFATKTEIKDKQDNLTGENIFLYNPKSFILIGNLNEFIIDEKINEVKFSSFEMFRKNLRNIEIITYDELYQRAYYICHKKE